MEKVTGAKIKDTLLVLVHCTRAEREKWPELSAETFYTCCIRESELSILPQQACSNPSSEVVKVSRWFLLQFRLNNNNNEFEESHMASKTAATWQEELAKYCQERRLPSPVYNIISDRRGGRTAWSATVTIQSQNIPARYWYDGQYLNNAKEDASEVACTRLRNPAITENYSNRSTSWQGEAREEEKVEPEEEMMPEGAMYKVGQEGENILD